MNISCLKNGQHATTNQDAASVARDDEIRCAVVYLFFNFLGSPEPEDPGERMGWAGPVIRR